MQPGLMGVNTIADIYGALLLCGPVQRTFCILSTRHSWSRHHNSHFTCHESEIK